MSTIRARWSRVRDQVAEAALAAGRDPAGVRVVAVTKGVSIEGVREVVDAGAALLGENRLQEAETKVRALGPAVTGVEWHLIGHLQGNKARRAAGLFEVIESVDSLELARRLDALGREAGRPLRVLLEVKTADDAAKTGLPEGGAQEAIAEALTLPGLRVEGLMTMAPWTKDAGRIRASFTRLRALRDRVGGAARLPELSMGMSADFPIAIEEGATLVRLGTAIFG